jgi:hypothetical protein
MAALAIALISLPAFAGNGQNLLQYVPADAAIVVSIDVEQLRSSSIYALAWGMITADSEVQEVLGEMESQAGFDPNADISGFLIALSGNDEEKFSLLLEGRFETERITTFLATLDATDMATIDYSGFTVYHDPSDTGGNKTYFTFISDTIVAFGTQEELSAVLDTIGGAANVTTNASVNALITAVDMSGSFWFAGALSPTMMADMAGTPMAGMITMRGAGTLAGGLDIGYVLGTVGADEAAGLSEFLNQGLVEARTAPEIGAMGLGTVLESVAIAHTGTDVSITVAIPEATLNQLMGFLTAIMAAQGGGF